MKIVVAVAWVRTQAWYYILAQLTQNVFLGIAYVTMSSGDDVHIKTILAGDVAFTLVLSLGLSIVVGITYAETDYQATDFLHED